jgi:hypothetical protein
VLEHALHALEQPLPRDRGREVRRRRARPHRHDGRAELGGDVDRAGEHPHALAAPFGQQRREVLAARVEREARAGLHHARQPELVEEVAQRRGARAHQRRVGIEVHVVERERDAVVAVVREQAQRVLQPVADEAVGHVAVAQTVARALGLEAAGPSVA